MLLERFRLLVGVKARNSLGPPQHPPHLGALLEAYRAAGVKVELQPQAG